MNSKISNALIVLVLSTIFSCICTATDICTKHLHYLASNQKDFVYCATFNAVPVELCIGCVQKYSKMVEAYIALSDDKNCTNKYFDKDRINIVSTTQSILSGLWEKAYCDDCFNGNNSSVFNDKWNELKKCFEENRTSKDICTSCLEHYQDLNKFYITLDEKNNGKICYDLQDSMNRTRSRWSKEFNCCHSESSKLLFLIVSGFVALLPILFYASTFALTKRRERNHGILNEDPEFDAPTSTSAVTPSVLPAATPVAPVSFTSNISAEPSSSVH